MTYDVIIAGGGLAGLSLACLLGDRSLSVAVVEGRTPASPPHGEYDVRVSAVTPGSHALFARTGVWERLDTARIGRIERMRVWEDPQRVLRFDADDIGVPALGYIVENNTLGAALWERVRRHSNVRIHCPAEIVGMAWKQSEVIVATTDGELRGRLLVGADGAQSPARHHAGIEVREWDYGQDAIVAHVRTSLPHNGTAWQRFMDTGPLALLPMPDPDVVSIVWSCTRERARALMTLATPDFDHELQTAFGDALGTLRTLSARASFSLGRAHARHYVSARLALLGDAAHRVHPLAGQGANLGFGDAAALADTLLAASTAGRDIGEYGVLRKYERRRKEDNAAMLAVTDALQRLFGREHTRLRALASHGLGVLDGLPSLKLALMRQAMGVEAP